MCVLPSEEKTISLNFILFVLRSARINIFFVSSRVTPIIEQMHAYLLSLFMYFRPLRNASPENYVSACDCYDDGVGDDDDDGAPDAASERPFPVDSDDQLEGPGCP